LWVVVRDEKSVCPHFRHHQVYFWDPSDRLGLGRGVAAGHHDERPGRPPLGVAGELARVLIGLAGDRAGVDDVDVRRLLEGHEHIARLLEGLADLLAVVLVDLAAQRLKGQARWGMWSHD